MNKSYTLGSRATNMLRDVSEKIAGGAWRQGERLPTERALAAQYGLARNTVRRALETLEQRGKLVRQVGRGTFVQETPQLGDDPGRPLADAGRPLGDLARRVREIGPEDVMEGRAIIEPEMAALAASRATAPELREIERLLRDSISAK